VGANPKAHVIQVASPAAEGHVGADATMSARIGKLPAQGAAFVLEAPLRRDTPIAAAMGMPPLDEAITLSVVPSSTALSIVGDLDLDITVQVLGPMLFQPVGQPGGPGAPGAPGVPPGAMTAPPGVPQPPGVPPPGVPTGPPPTKPPPGGTGKPPI